MGIEQIYIDLAKELDLIQPSKQPCAGLSTDSAE